MRHAGFTLIELIIAIVLLGMLGVVGISLINDTMTTTQYANANQATSAQIRYALERLEREIREVKKNGGSYCIDTIAWAGSSNLVFRKTSAAGLTNPVSTDCNTEITRTSISTSGNTLNLGYSPDANTAFTSAPLLNGNLNLDPSIPLLRYFQSDGTTPATATDNIHFVEINLRVSVIDPSGQVFQNITEQSRVALREN